MLKITRMSIIAKLRNYLVIPVVLPVKKMATSCTLWVRKVSKFPTKLYRGHTGSYLSGVYYSDVVLGQFE